MGDPHIREFPVYLPPGYDSKRSAPYPVAIILAGWGGKGSAYITEDSAFGLSLAKRLDKAIEEGRLPACIVVFPDGSSRLGGSQYINSPALGYYSDYICDEVTSFIDREFHTYASADYRALLGHSSGGFGALINGFLRPDRFKYINSSAGDTFFELCFLPTVRLAVDEIEKSGGIEKFLKDFLNHPNPKSLSRTKGETMMLLSMAPCFSPNVSVPHIFGDLFFDLHTGAINSEIWNRYLMWDPIHFVNSHKESASQLSFVYLDSGKQDEYGLQLGHRQLAQHLKALQIPFEIDEYAGGHSGHNWRFETRLIKTIAKMFTTLAPS